MIERLVTSLRALAAPAEAQLCRLPPFVSAADELAREFDDALLLVRQCQSHTLAPEQAASLDRLERALAQYTSEAPADFWTADSVRTSVRWATLRELADAALMDLQRS